MTPEEQKAFREKYGGQLTDEGWGISKQDTQPTEAVEPYQERQPLELRKRNLSKRVTNPAKT